jgi:glycosyltransferase involved in cell wall biosynthesis
VGTKSKSVKITLVIPVFNEEQSIPHLLNHINKFVQREKKYEFDLIFIDDGSTDESIKMIIKYAPITTKVLKLDRNRGHQFALSAGLREADGDWIVTMDADLQHPLETVSEMLRIFSSSDYEVIQTFQEFRTKGTFMKRILSSLFWSLIRIGREKIRQKNVGDFRIMRNSLVERLNNYSDPKVIRFLIPILSNNILYLPFVADHRVAGTPKYSYGKMFQLALDGYLQISSRPLKSIAKIGLVSLILTTSYAVYVAWNYFNHRALPGWTSLVLITVFFGSLNLIAASLVGEYVARLYEKNSVIKNPYKILEIKR